MRNPSHFRFRLYVAGETQNSARAVANLKAICAQHMPNRYAIEIIDVFKEPQRALSDSILMTPTLVKLQPLPEQRIVGVLSDNNLVLQVLGLAS